jgi:DNA (cytosine-5)-methyltransferase 1
MLENVANLLTAALHHRKIEDRPGKHWNLKRYSSGSVTVDDGNAPMLPEERSGSAIRQILKDVQSLGYSVRFGILDAADYGAPQHRLRFFMLGSRDSIAPELPLPTHGIAKGLHRFRTVRDAIEDLRDVRGEHSVYGAEIAKYFRYIPSGGNWRDLPDHLKREAMGGAFDSGGGKTGFFRRLDWDAPAPTITARANRKGSAMCHPEFTRPLSVRECARLQGFPDTWEFAGAMNQQYMQIGNAVPVHLAKAVASGFVMRTPIATAIETDSEQDSVELMLDRAIKRLRISARNRRIADRNSSELLFA